jgi:hypothetical protein
MKFEFADIPRFTNEWDDLADAVLEAKGKEKSVVVPVPQDRTPASFRVTVKQNLKSRKLAVHTVCGNDVIYVWYKGRITEAVEVPE